MDTAGLVLRESELLVLELRMLMRVGEIREPDRVELLRMLREVRRFIEIDMPEERIPF